MQDVLTTPKIKEFEFDRLLDYYVLLQAYIDEAEKAGQAEMLLIPANIEEILRPLPMREEVLWRKEAAGVLPRQYGAAITTFLDPCLHWTTAQVAGSRKALPKPIPLAQEIGRWGRHRKGGPCSRSGRRPSWCPGTAEQW
jgi:hypothetical protein